jgi:multicomponent Na+:H+ antiporter subunit D
MVETVSIKPILAILISLIAFPLIRLSDQRPNLRETWSVGAGVLQFFTVISMGPAILAGQIITSPLYTFLPGLDLKLRVDALGFLFAMIASFLWILTSLYSIGYMRGNHEEHQTRYFSCFALALTSTLGVAFSANLLTLYICYEFLSLVTVPLVGHKETAESSAGAKKYLIYLAGTSKTALLAAIVLTYSIAGTLDFSPDGIFSESTRHLTDTTILVMVYVLFLVGFAKAGMMPFHSWLPAAMVAPTPVSALLHAVAVVKVGVFCVLRVIFHVMGVETMAALHLGIPTAVFVSFTILGASAYALTRDNLKARLAYSTISQLSYIILGGALLSPSGMMGGILHIAAHAFSKITLFFCAGSIYVATHKTNISTLSGIGRQMPWTMTAFTLGALGMIGVPPLAGFLSKWYLALGSVEAGSIPILIVLLTSTLLNAAYFVPVIYKGFFESPETSHPQSLGAEAAHHPDVVKETPLMVIPLMIAAIGSIAIGIFPYYFLQLAERVVQ